MRENKGIRGQNNRWFDETIQSLIDDKGRVYVPQHFLEGLGRIFFIAAVPRGDHLALFPERAWKAYVKPLLRTNPLDALEFSELKPFLGGLSARMTLDARGRITLPGELRDLVKGDEVVFVGAFDTVRLYGTDTWARFIRDMKRRSSAQGKKEFKRWALS